MLRKPEISQIEHIHPLALHKHIARHFRKHAHRYIHIAQHLHHTFMHYGELLLVLMVGMSGILFANFTGSLEWMERDSTTEIATYLTQAINHPEYILTKWNLISIWKVDDSIDNTFAKWYCTYGAARISPEFFPYITPTTQERKRGGNAVDRCANAEATWYRVGNTPAQWALVVYNGGGRFGPYGHVGKVMYYNQWLHKIIVRDMARVSKFTMSDRRDDLNTADVECYIYNVRSAVAGPILTGSLTAIATWTTHTWTNTTTQTPVVDPHPSAPDTSTTNTPTNTTTPSTPVVVTPPVVETPVIVTPPAVVTPTNPVVTTPVSDQDISLNFDDVNDYLAVHYLWQRDIHAQISSKATMQVGDEAILTITIKNRQTQENIDGLLPIIFEFISSNDNINVDYSSIRLISDGKIEIHVSAMQTGKASLIINFWDVKIGRVGFDIK
jgi:surface antigen